jgi:CTD kinase subunit gamma
MNNRANIMYFIEHLCDMASREGHHDYVRMMQRDILRVVDAVAPEDGSGAANVKVVRKVLNALQSKSFLLAQTVSEIEECLKERDTIPDSIGLSSPLIKDVEMTNTQTPKMGKSNGFQQKFDKKQIEQRIEEDRERHKRLRETIWAVPTAGMAAGKTPQQVADDDAEFEKMWEETSDLGEDDFDLYAEEAEEREAAAREWAEEHKARTMGGGD